MPRTRVLPHVLHLQGGTTYVKTVFYEKSEVRVVFEKKDEICKQSK